MMPSEIDGQNSMKILLGINNYLNLHNCDLHGVQRIKLLGLADNFPLETLAIAVGELIYYKEKICLCRFDLPPQ